MSKLTNLITSVILSVPLDTNGDGEADDCEEMTFASMEEAGTYLSGSTTSNGDEKS